MSAPLSHSLSAPRPRSLRARGDILLVSCYELGQQPLGLAVAAAHLHAAGFAPATLDLAVQPFDDGKVAGASLVAISIPMHTAMRIGLRAAERVRKINPRCHLAFYGLYAALNAERLLATVADSCFGGEYAEGLVALAAALERGRVAAASGCPPDPTAELRVARARRSGVPPPRRAGLPAPDRYARLVCDAGTRLVGYVAATRGCKHLCRHCAVPPVYAGRFIAMPMTVVIEDIAGLVESGVGHVTFADPDFLNGPGHARRIAEALHEKFPGVTFDFTAKVEHLLAHRVLVRDLEQLGCLFVTSAIESLSDRTLAHLAKGHARSDIASLVRFLRSVDLALRPSLVPFTPWDTLEDFIDLLDFIEAEKLVDHVDPVQYTIRLLVPPGSLLLSSPAMRHHLTHFDDARLTYEWRHPDPRMDALQADVAALVARDTADGIDPALTFFRIRRCALDAAGVGGRALDDAGAARRFPADRPRPPRLTEDWFC